MEIMLVIAFLFFMAFLYGEAGKKRYSKRYKSDQTLLEEWERRKHNRGYLY